MTKLISFQKMLERGFRLNDNNNSLLLLTDKEIFLEETRKELINLTPIIFLQIYLQNHLNWR